MKYFPKTIMHDLVEVKPLSPFSLSLFYTDIIYSESEADRIIRENKIRQAKLDAICNDTEFVWLDEYNEPNQIGYNEYIAENLDNSIEYSEYIAENLDNSIEYSEYIAENLDNSIQYTEYIATNLDTSNDI